MSREDPQFKLRLPAELKARIDEAAAGNRRSINAELIARLETTFELDQFMSERKAGSYAEAYDMLESVLADNDRMTASGEQSFGTAYSLVEKLLEEKLAPIRELLAQKSGRVDVGER